MMIQTPKVKWLFEQVQTPFRLLAFVSSDIFVIRKHLRGLNVHYFNLFLSTKEALYRFFDLFVHALLYYIFKDVHGFSI